MLREQEQAWLLAAMQAEAGEIWKYGDPTSHDLRAALDYLRSLPLVDQQRIGLVGASMGGHASVIVAADDPGVRAVAVSSAPYHDAGATAVDELAFAIASAR